MYYDSRSSDVIPEGKWDEKSCVRRQGGYDIDMTGLPEGMKWLPKGAVMYFIADSGKVGLLKTATVYEAFSEGSSSVKIEKGHLFKVGDDFGGAEILAITTGDDYDTLTLDSTEPVEQSGTPGIPAAGEVGDVFDDGNAANALGLNYAPVRLIGSPSCTVTVQAYEIEEDTLPYPINDAIKTALTCRHAYKIG